MTQMFEDMKSVLTDWEDEDQIRAYLEALLDKKAFDRKGLIYGMGHAVYSISDPRADIFKGFVKKLAKEKGHEAEYGLYEKVEHLAPEIIGEKRERCIRALMQTSIFTADLSTVCSIFRRHCTHRFLRRRVL